MSFEIIRNDITRVRADAIVNTANPGPIVGGGTDQAIYEAAGKEELLAERRRIGDIARGQAVETPAFHLQAKYIIHTVGPVWEGGQNGEYEILRSCYENSLQLALKLKCRSIAFPLIATGVYGFPKDKALQTALSVIQPFVMEHSMKVILVVFDRKAFELSGSLVENVREFVDSNYVRKASENEYSGDYAERTSGRYGNIRRNIVPDMEKAGSRYEEDADRCLDLRELPEPPAVYSCQKNAAANKKPKEKIDITKLVASPEKTFQQKLFEIIDDRGLTGPQVYKNYISKQVYSKIQSDKDYHPNKFTAIALCLSLHLNIDETLDLIGRAGWTLSKSNKADLVVTGCIMNEEYNLVQINILLFDFDCPELEKIK